MTQGYMTMVLVSQRVLFLRWTSNGKGSQQWLSAIVGMVDHNVTNWLLFPIFCYFMSMCPMVQYAVQSCLPISQQGSVRWQAQSCPAEGFLNGLTPCTPCKQRPHFINLNPHGNSFPAWQPDLSPLGAAQGSVEKVREWGCAVRHCDQLCLWPNISKAH